MHPSPEIKFKVNVSLKTSRKSEMKKKGRDCSLIVVLLLLFSYFCLWDHYYLVIMAACTSDCQCAIISGLNGLGVCFCTLARISTDIYEVVIIVGADNCRCAIIALLYALSCVRFYASSP